MAARATPARKTAAKTSAQSPAKRPTSTAKSAPPRRAAVAKKAAAPKAKPVPRAATAAAAEVIPSDPAAGLKKPPRYREAPPPAIKVEEFRKVVKSRRSIRKFTNKPIPKAVLDDCLDLAMLAPNSSNLQPWGFYVVQTPARREALVRACLSQNAAKTAAELIVVVARTGTYLENARLNLAEWPGPMPLPRIMRDYYAKLVPLYYTQGPLGSFGLIKKGVARVAGRFKPTPRGPYSHAEMKVWAVKSTALAAENLMLAMRAYGFDTCPMEGFDEARVRRLLKLPSDAHVVMVLGCGERAEDGVYYPQMRFARERFVFTV
jgi:nitroreductase